MSDSKHIRAALFDLDGVVFDTEPQYSRFWGGQCRLYHPDQPGLENMIKGQTLVQIFDRFFSGELKKERETITRRLDDFELTMRFDYINGFTGFIALLRSHGVKTAIVTSSNKTKMAVVRKRHPELAELFDTILTSEDFERSKPDPDCYLKAARRLECAGDECVVFEDSINGLSSARAAKMFVVGLATTNSLDTVKPLCDLPVTDFTELDYSRLVTQFSMAAT